MTKKDIKEKKAKVKKPVKIKKVKKVVAPKVAKGPDEHGRVYAPGPYKKGVSGNPFGRPKSSAINAFKQRLEELDYDTIATVVDLARNGEPDKVKIEAAGLLLSRQYPALKSIELSAGEGARFSLNIIKTPESKDKTVIIEHSDVKKGGGE